jgi:hypothetical protein
MASTQNSMVVRASFVSPEKDADVNLATSLNLNGASDDVPKPQRRIVQGADVLPSAGTILPDFGSFH